MSAEVVLPLWQILLMVTGIVVVVGGCAGYLGARIGAKLGVQACAQHWQCPLQQQAKADQFTADLAARADEFERQHPEIVAIREAAARELKDTGREHPAIPEGEIKP